jgi:hypothetical protein
VCDRGRRYSHGAASPIPVRGVLRGYYSRNIGDCGHSQPTASTPLAVAALRSNARRYGDRDGLALEQNKTLTNPLRHGGFCERPRGERGHDLNDLRLRGVEILPIQSQKDHAGQEGRALVPVIERMHLREPERVRRRKGARSESGSECAFC